MCIIEAPIPGPPNATVDAPIVNVVKSCEVANIRLPTAIVKHDTIEHIVGPYISNTHPKKKELTIATLDANPKTLGVCCDCNPAPPLTSGAINIVESMAAHPNMIPPANAFCNIANNKTKILIGGRLESVVLFRKQFKL